MRSQAHAVFTGRTVATGRWTDTTSRLLISIVVNFMPVSVSTKAFHY